MKRESSKAQLHVDLGAVDPAKVIEMTGVCQDVTICQRGEVPGVMMVK